MNLFSTDLTNVRRCIQKFPDWPPGARTANGTALCQLYRYFVSQSSEFFRHNPLCCFSTSVYCCLFRYGSVLKILDTPSYLKHEPRVDFCNRERQQNFKHANSSTAGQEIPAFCGSRRSITMYPRARHWSLL
jgi:hypothetical protein